MNINATSNPWARVRALAAALAIGATVLSLSVAPAHAAKNMRPKDNGVRCSTTGVGGSIDFYMPGEVVTYANGLKLRCGSDGKWHEVRTDVTPSGPRPGDGGGVYAP